MKFSSGYSVFLDVFEPDNGCAVLVKSPASTDEPGCGYVVGYFKNAVCTKMSLDKTFMIQHCCNGDCEKATGSPKMVRGLENRRSLGGRSVEIKGKDGRVVEPIEIGYPPQMRRSTAPTETFTEVQLAPRKDDADCKTYIPDGEVYTRPDNKTQIVAAVSTQFHATSTTSDKTRTLKAVLEMAKQPSLLLVRYPKARHSAPGSISRFSPPRLSLLSNKVSPTRKRSHGLCLLGNQETLDSPRH